MTARRPPTYAGVGSREAPGEKLLLMRKLARRLGDIGAVLRTGGAKGSDSFFEDGARTAPRGPAPCELYLPWAEFRDKTGTVLGSDASRRARQLASDHHPAWERCSQRAKQLHARNAAIMLGPEPGTSREDPVDVVVCWTRRGETIGGTGMAIRIARAKKIPVVNLYHHHQIKTVVNAIAEVTNDPRWRDAAPKKSESPQMRVGSGGASSMPPQQRNSMEINAPGEWKP